MDRFEDDPAHREAALRYAAFNRASTAWLRSEIHADSDLRRASAIMDSDGNIITSIIWRELWCDVFHQKGPLYTDEFATRLRVIGELEEQMYSACKSPQGKLGMHIAKQTLVQYDNERRSYVLPISDEMAAVRLKGVANEMPSSALSTYVMCCPSIKHWPPLITICTSPPLLVLALIVFRLFTTVLTLMMPVNGIVLLPWMSFAFETVTLPICIFAMLVLKIKSPKLMVMVDGLGRVRFPITLVPSASGVDSSWRESRAKPWSWFSPATTMVLSIVIGLLIAPRCRLVFPRKLISLVTSLLNVCQKSEWPGN